MNRGRRLQWASDRAIRLKLCLVLVANSNPNVNPCTCEARVQNTWLLATGEIKVVNHGQWPAASLYQNNDSL